MAKEYLMAMAAIVCMTVEAAAQDLDLSDTIHRESHNFNIYFLDSQPIGGGLNDLRPNDVTLVGNEVGEADLGESAVGDTGNAEAGLLVQAPDKDVPKLEGPASPLAQLVSPGVHDIFIEHPTLAREPVCEQQNCCCTHRRRCRQCRMRYNVLSNWWHHKAKPCLQDSHWGYASEFCERGFGTYTASYLHSQIANGVADQIKLYHYDFQAVNGPRAGELTERGHYELRQIAAKMQRYSCRVLIQQTWGAPDIDEARRQTVANQLANLGVSGGPDLVLIDGSNNHGMSGVESIIIEQNLLQQTTDGGSGTSYGGGGETTFSLEETTSPGNR